MTYDFMSGLRESEDGVGAAKRDSGGNSTQKPRALENFGLHPAFLRHLQRFE